MAEGDAKVLYAMPVIDGKKVMVFECGRPPIDDRGEPNVAAFAFDRSSNRDVYYEATDTSASWFKSPFYVGRTAPTDDELQFQLRKWHSDRQLKLSIAIATGIGFLLWLIYR